MASRYPVRNHDPFGYNDVDLDASDDNEMDEHKDDNIVQASSDEFSSSSDEDEGTSPGEAIINLWNSVDQILMKRPTYLDYKLNMTNPWQLKNTIRI